MVSKIDFKIYKPTTKEEQSEELQTSKYYSLCKQTTLIEECSKITISIIRFKEFDVINSITVDDKTLNIDDFRNADFIQIFKVEVK